MIVDLVLLKGCNVVVMGVVWGFGCGIVWCLVEVGVLVLIVDVDVDKVVIMVVELVEVLGLCVILIRMDV